ncbi:hypothetical protein [Methylocystis hirsuta]|uniref:hypothetical protein n=1 Tax=Methylocystis hirsuta TaxID=369798 RepID=UPI001AECD633|nr:hypothetical protein [Methylocystis hirsuta]
MRRAHGAAPGRSAQASTIARNHLAPRPRHPCALESAGVDFIAKNSGGPGVRLRKAKPT